MSSWFQRFARLVVRVDLATLSKAPRVTWATQLAARLAPQYRQCWLLMDRDTEAHDNAEHLYRYLRAEHPEINAWFVLRRESPDWDRLAAEGFRLIPYGSRDHVLALTQCIELVSSQIDHYVISPPMMAWLRVRPWYFTWLQHGVIQSDLSGWLAGKPARTVVATTPAERHSLARPPYTWTDREVLLTGQPRHDALLRRAAQAAPEDRTLILFAPTWRVWLVRGSGTGNDRTASPDLATSEWARSWHGLLASAAVRDAAAQHGLEIVVLPHPNMAPHIDALALPPHVRVASYADDDVQDLLAHTAVLVTDYSSVAFDAALIERPVLYFQFDAQAVHGGSDHIGRLGYFFYDRDGLGPVAETPPAAERALVKLIEGGPSPAEPYATRIKETFTMRDGNACERVTRAIVAHRTAGRH